MAKADTSRYKGVCGASGHTINDLGYSTPAIEWVTPEKKNKADAIKLY